MGAEHQQGLTGSGAFALDPTSPFEASIIEIVEMQRAKNRDYAEDGSVFSNFEMTAALTDGLPEESALFNVAQKLVRLRSLKANGRTADPTNESVQDTYLDLAVYACIAYAIVQRSAREVAALQRKDMLTDMTDEINRTVEEQRTKPRTGGLITDSTRAPVYPYTLNQAPGGVTTTVTVTGSVRDGVDWRDQAFKVYRDVGEAKRDDDDGDGDSVGATA